MADDVASFEISRSGDDLRWRDKAGNGEVVATVEDLTVPGGAAG